MEEITLDVVLSQPQSELKLLPSPKRPRTDCTNGHSGKSQFHFPELLTFQDATITPPLTVLMPESVGLECTAECGNDKYQTNEKQLQDIQPVTRLTPPQHEEVNTGSPSACFMIPERRVLLGRDAPPPADESDELSSCTADDAGEAFEESHSSKDARADSSSQPDCDCLGKSLEDEPPGAANLPPGNDRAVSQIQAFSLSSSDEELMCLSDFTFAGELCDTGFCHIFNLHAGEEEYSQRGGKGGFSENKLFNVNEADSLIFSVVHTDSDLFSLVPDVEPYGSLAQGVKSETGTTEMQLCEDEDFTVWDAKTKAQVNENGMNKNPVPCTAEWAEGSIVSYDVVLVRNIGAETVSPEADDFSGAERARAARKMIAKTGSEMADHTSETPVPAGISQEPAEGDNDAGPLAVIDPAIWSESDGEAVEKCCDSQSAAGAELSTFVKVCVSDTPLSPEAQPPHQDSASVLCTALLSRDQDLSQSFTEAQASLTTSVKHTHSNTNHEGSQEWKSCPSSSCRESPPGLDKTPESSDSVGRNSPEQEQSCCFPASLDNLLAQEVEYLLPEFTRMDETTQLKKDTQESEENEKLECSIDLEKKLQEMGNDREELSKKCMDDLLNEWVQEEINNCGHTWTPYGGASENNLQCLSDHLYTAVFLTSGETLEERDGQEAEDAQVGGRSDVFVKLTDSEQERDSAEDSPDEHMSEQSEAVKSQRGDKSVLDGQREPSVETCCQPVDLNRPESADLLASSFPLSSDAVVPGPHEFRPLQTTDQNPAAVFSGDGCSLLPSASPSCVHVYWAFDTFEKVELSRDNDEDNDAGLSDSPLLTSMSQQLLETPQRPLLPVPEGESSEREEVPRGEEEEEEEEEGKEEDVGRFECNTDDMANGLPSCDYACDELSNFICAADVPTLCWPEPKPDSESAFKSSEGFQDEPVPVSWDISSESLASDVNEQAQFEMRPQFDRVVKELNLFFDVSIDEFDCFSGESSTEQCGDGTETWESHASHTKDQHTPPDDADEVGCLDVCGWDPAVSRTPGSGDGEQEVPRGSCQEASVPAAEEHKELQEMESKRKTWSPAFMTEALVEQLSFRLPEPSRRLEPLKTCTRPLRVGLSKKAKTKHLHRPHPYK